MLKQKLASTPKDQDDLKDFHNRYMKVGRSPKMIALTHIRATLLKSAREFFDQDGWLEVSPVPAISSLAGACEDFSTLFSLKYYDKRAFLIQTGQQHLEAYIYGPIRKVYAFNQSYRAETQAPNRRLSSFLLIEAEAADFSLPAIQEVQEKLLYKLCKDIVATRQAELQVLGANISKLIDFQLHLDRKLQLDKILYKDAVLLLNKAGDTSIHLGEDLKSSHEIALGKKMGQPFFVTNYPAAIKFFNMKSDPDNPGYVLSSDLLVPGYGEIIGSSEREDDYEKLVQKLDEFGKNKKRLSDMKNLRIGGSDELKEVFKWYLELRKPRKVQHSGFGLGFERLIQWICDFESIIESTEFPKTMDNL